MSIDSLYGINGTLTGQQYPGSIDSLLTGYGGSIFAGADLDLLEVLLLTEGGLGFSDFGGLSGLTGFGDGFSLDNELYNWSRRSAGLTDRPAARSTNRFAEHRVEPEGEEAQAGFDLTSGIEGYVSGYRSLRVTEFGSRAARPTEHRGKSIHDSTTQNTNHHIEGTEKSDFIHSTGDILFGTLSIDSGEGPDIIVRKGSASNTEIKGSGLIFSLGSSTGDANVFNPNTTEITGSDRTDDLIYDRARAEGTYVEGGDGIDTYIGDLRDSTSGEINIQGDVERAIFVLSEGYDIRVDEDADNRYVLYHGDTATDRVINYDKEHSSIEIARETNREAMEAVRGIIEDKATQIADLRGDG